jgi:hypothetical protein
MPWPSACHQGTRAALLDGSYARASPRPPPSPPSLCVAQPPACAYAPFLLHGASAQPPPPAWHGQPPRTKVRSFTLCHGRCRCLRARAAPLPSVHARHRSIMPCTDTLRSDLHCPHVRAYKTDPHAICPHPHCCLPLVSCHHRASALFRHAIGAESPHPPSILVCRF